MSERLTLRVGISPYEQMNASCLSSYAKGDHDCEPGMELEILNLVASSMNVTLRVLATSDEFGCGWLDENGTWTGLLGMLERDEIDVTGNLCAIEKDRAAVPTFEPSWPVLQYKQGFLIKKPSAEYHFKIFAPFQPYVWLALFAVAFFFVLMTSVAARLINRGELNFGISTFLSATFQYLRPAVSDRLSSKVKLLRSMWVACFAFTSTVYAAYITVVVLNPTVKHRPFSNQLQLADSLLSGEYRLLDYHRSTAIMPQCYPESTCEKIRLALKRHSYVKACGDNAFDDAFLGRLVAPNSGNLVLVKSYYWLQMYADDFGGRRSDLWLIEDTSSSEKLFSFFRRRNASFRHEFDETLIRMDAFTYYLPELYVGMARHVFRGERFRGPLPERYRIDFRLIRGPGKCYALGVACAVIVFVIEKMWNRYVHEDDTDRAGRATA